jgi:hypothetical protein
MTCHQIGSQMITIGGSNASNITANCDSATQGVRVLDLTQLTWGTAFNPNNTAYQLPNPLVKVVGGT